MKIRHLLEPNGAKVVFACPFEPYVRELPVLYWALVTQHTPNPDTGETTAEDKVVGMVANGKVLNAEDTQPNGFVFCAYILPGQLTADEESTLRNRIREWGHSLQNAGEEGYLDG